MFKRKTKVKNKKKVKVPQIQKFQDFQAVIFEINTKTAQIKSMNTFVNKLEGVMKDLYVLTVKGNKLYENI